MPTANEYNVSPRAWQRWDGEQRAYFNWLYELVLKSQWVFSHVDAATIPDEHWCVTAWNVAFMATGALTRYKEEK